MFFFNWLYGWFRLKPPRPVTNVVVNLTITTIFHYHHHRRRIRTMTTATIRWTDPVSRIDGSLLAPADIASIEVTDSNPDGSSEVLGNVLPGVQNFTTGPLAVGDHAFTMVVKDTTGHSSARSAVTTVTVVATLADPNPVTDVTAVLN